MDATLHALGGILLHAIPTFLLVIALSFFLRYAFFGPLERVLQARYEASEGTRLRAEQTLRQMEARAAEYDAALRAARAEIYEAQMLAHQRFESERAAAAAAARARADGTIRQAKAQLAGDIAAAKLALAQESDELASRIADAILNRGLA